MCHQSKVQQDHEQVEQMVENGMPRKIMKTVAYTLKKRAEAAEAAAEEETNLKVSDLNNNGVFLKLCKLCGGLVNCKNPKFCECEFDGLQIATDVITQNTESVGPATDIIKTIPKGCGRAAALAAAAARVSGQNSDTAASYKHYVDFLCIVTHFTKLFCQRITQLAERTQKSKLYICLTATTQPAHIIAILILSFVLLSVWPNILENEDVQKSQKEKDSGLALVFYLGAFAAHFGAQIWMTFVSGLSLYFSLPRHTFGLCQQILFPKYFGINSVLSVCTLILFIKLFSGRWEFSSYVQLTSLSICAVIEVTVRLYLTPPLLHLMHEKHKFEVSVGIGQEIGRLELGDLIKCPHYRRVHKAFRRVHTTAAMLNMATMLCTFLHLHYLASKISIS